MNPKEKRTEPLGNKIIRNKPPHNLKKGGNRRFYVCLSLRDQRLGTRQSQYMKSAATILNPM